MLLQNSDDCLFEGGLFIEDHSDNYLRKCESFAFVYHEELYVIGYLSGDSTIWLHRLSSCLRSGMAMLQFALFMRAALSCGWRYQRQNNLSVICWGLRRIR